MFLPQYQYNDVNKDLLDVRIVEGVSVFVKPEHFNKYQFFFTPLKGCVGLCITLKNGENFLYHHSGMDSLHAIEKELKSRISGSDIKSIRLFGGNITNACISLEDDVIYQVSNDNPAERKNIGVYQYKNRKDKPYANLIFRISKNETQVSDEIDNSLILDSIYNSVEHLPISQLLSQKSSERIRLLKQTIESKTYKAQARGRDGEVYEIDVKNVQNFIGIRNIYAINTLLRNLFPNITPEHYFTNHFDATGNLKILPNGTLEHSNDKGSGNIILQAEEDKSVLSNDKSIYQTYLCFPNNGLNAFKRKTIDFEGALEPKMRLDSFLDILHHHRIKKSNAIATDCNIKLSTAFLPVNFEMQKPPYGTTIKNGFFSSSDSIETLLKTRLATNSDIENSCFRGRVVKSSIMKKEFPIQQLIKEYSNCLEIKKQRSVQR